ncbi:MAG: phage tail family protein [Clostridia bacterium]|nr:phage tail family protein [Clostridia bacterium]
MRLIFKTDAGVITMSGKSDTDYVIKSVSGLSVPERNYECISYYGADGKTTLNSFFSSRIITLSADIYNCNKTLMRRTSKILFNEGTLTVTEGHIKKMISYKPLKLDFGERHGLIQSFAFQIECDNPYFYDVFNTTRAIYTRKNNITSPFTLPTVFSTRVSETVIVNNGDVKVYPTVVISPASSSDASGTYTISNLTTGASIMFSLTCQSGEKITADFAKRTITSSLKGSIANSLKKGNMSDFFLSKGENIITCTCSNTSVSPNSILIFKNHYTEAI